ncbi:hypothetical protein [Alteribacillus iranensis]|uniref:Uncharacterized protein n=1 Tax=Alteribacillus iranensis TaxID=930128 RepID=A0A1I2BFV0_9BACI|nr:hypothetical protein [Alteribacillus iranensis]SFE54758.1 hypothetical protein SAMN05192532_102269 [Alteribacillus iranensis]
MKVTMDLEQATYHVEKTKPLKLKEIEFKVKPDMQERKRLFRTSLYELTIITEVHNQMYEFVGYDLNHKLISQLEKDPSGFLVGSEPPFLCGTDWPDSGISEVIEENNVPSDSLFVTDGNHVIATVYRDEIPPLINWFKKLV